MNNGFRVDKRGIAKMAREIQREFNKHPIRVPFEHQRPSTAPGPSVASASITYNGPVFHGDVHGAQLAWGNGSVTQTQQVRSVTSGYEELAELLVRIRRELGSVGLDPEDTSDASILSSRLGRVS